MPQDVPGAVDPLAPFEGEYELPGLGLTRRWLDPRDLTSEERAEILEVIRIAFNDQVSWFELPVAREDHFDWKFRDRPTGATAHLSVDRGRIVGFTGGVRRVWLVQGRRCVGRAGYDLCLLPEWQGKGVQRSSRPFAQREWHPSEDLGLGWVTHPSDRYLSIQRGETAPANETHDFVRQLGVWRRLRRGLHLGAGGPAEEGGALRGEAGGPPSKTSAVLRERARGRFDRARERIAGAALFARSLVARRRAPREPVCAIRTLERFDERHRGMLTKAVGQFDFVGERTAEYLNWRHLDERAGPFTVRLAEDDGEPLGYAATRVLGSRAYIADILALPGRTDVAESLIRDAVALAERGGAETLTVQLPKRHPYRDALMRAGFYDVGHRGGELLQTRRMPAEELEFLDRDDTAIHLVLADSDFV